MAEVSIDLGEVSLEIPRTVSKEMISVGKRDGKTLVRINYSSMDIIQNCLRKAQYSLHEKWKPIDEAVATVFGSAFHKALEVFYRGSIEERKLPRLETMEMMAFGHPAEGEETDLLLRSTRAFINAAKVLEPLPATDKHSIVNGCWILFRYFSVYLDDPYVAYVDALGPFVERTFDLVLSENNYLIIELFGTIDIVMQNTITKELLPADHKTAGFLNFGGSSYFDREKPAHQYTGYLLGAREVFGIDTDKFMVNIVEKKPKPKGPKAMGVSFPRQITTRNEDDFADFRQAMQYVVTQYLSAINTDIWPQGPVGSCTAYGSCSYRQVCSVPKAQRKNILAAKFKQEGALIETQ